MMSEVLLGKRALVTGGARGIGRATALRLARAGADVAINFVTNESGAREVANEVLALGSRALLVKGDVSEEEDVRTMVEMVGKEWGGLDVLVSNAASGGFRPMRAATCRNFDAAMHTNARALLLLVQAALPWFERSTQQKKVVAVSSHGSDRALPDYGLIGASKAALESLIRHMALEFGGLGINFNTVLAGLVATDSTKQMPHAEEAYRLADASMMIGGARRLMPEDVAEAICFLASPASDLVQGHTLVIDGGASLRM